MIIINFFYQSRVESYSSFISTDNTYPAHLHRQVEIMFVIDGSLETTIEERTYKLNTGDIAVTFPDKIHSLNTPNHSKVLLLVFDMDYLQDFRIAFKECTPKSPIISLDDISDHGKNALSWLISLSKNMPATADMPNIEGISYHENNTDSSKMIMHPVVTDTRKIVDDQKDLSPNQLYTKSYLAIFLTDIFYALELEKRQTFTDKNICENILVYLDQHYQEDISLESTAKAIGISKFYLSQIFSNKLHTSFPSYVTARRLDYAEKLLITTSLPITEVAYQAGFTSQRTFFRSFQESYGTTPHQYRKNHSSF